MPKRFFLRVAAALWAVVAFAAFAYEPEVDDLAGPPLYTSAGCRGDQPFTVDYVATVLGVDAKIVKRMLKRYGLHPWNVCALDAKRIGPLIEHTRMNKFGYDEPDEGMRYRRLSYLDHGTIRPNGIGIAAEQRRRNHAAAVAKGVREKAAGVVSTSWASLGPFDVGGRVRAIAPHPTIPNRILLGSVSGGIFRTTDGGATWRSVNDYLPSVTISSIIHDPANPNLVYAGTGEGYFNIDAMRGMGILKSADGGDTWAPMPGTDPALQPAFNYVNRIAIDPSNSQVMLAATRNGVLRTTDRGATWTQVTTTNTGDVKFDATGNRAIAGEYGSISYSTDHGATWTRVALGGQRVELAYSASTNNWFLQLDLNGGQVYKSTNGGASWVMVSQPAVLGIQGWYDNAIWVDPTNENRVIVGGSSNGVKMSVDGGVTFTAIGAGVHPDHHILVHDPNYASNGVVYNGNDGGIYKFSGVNAVTTPQFSPSVPAVKSLNNLPITQFYGGAGGKIPVGRIVGGTQDNGSLAWSESTNRWTQIAASDGGRNAVDPTDSAYLYGEFQWLALFRSTNGGADTYGVEMICAGIPDSDCSGNPKNANFISPMALDPANPNRMYAGGASLWRSDNVRDAVAANVRWTRVKPAGELINAIAIAPGNSNVVWVGDNMGGIYRTMDATSAAPTWSANLSPVSSRQVMRILVDPDDPNRVFATFGGYMRGNVYMTTNALAATPTWVERSGTMPSALPDSPVRAIARHPLSPDWLYAGTEVGVFVSEDGGASWSTTNGDGPGTVSIEDLFFLDSTRLVAATHGRGMYVATVAPPNNARGTLQLSAATLGLVEGQAASIQVTRVGGSSGAIGVTVASVNGTASAGGDFTAINQALTWADGDTSARTIQVQALADAIAEGNETFSLALSNPTGGATLGSPSSATVTISDPDNFPVNCAMPSGWSKPAGANAGWSVDPATSMEGRCSLRSSAIGNGQEARIEYTGTFGAGNVTFNARVDSEPGADCLHFLVDGSERNIGTGCLSAGGANLGLVASSGTDTGWRSFSFPVAAGPHTIAFSYRKNASGAGGADAAWVDNVVLPVGQSASPITFVGAVSRKTHASTGTFDLPIDATKPIDDATIESRSLGSGHRIVFQFSGAVSSAGTVTVSDESGAPLSSFSTAVSGNNVEVTVTGLADNRRITIRLANVNGQGLDASAAVGFLEGDVDGSGTVTSSDVLRAKGKSGQPAGASTFLNDVNLTGAIDASDVSLVKQRAGVTL